MPQITPRQLEAQGTLKIIGVEHSPVVRQLDTPASAQAPPSAGGAIYHVVHVENWDVLYMRNGPDPNTPKVGSIPYNARNVIFLGETARYKKSTWYKVSYESQVGWVKRLLSHKDQLIRSVSLNGIWKNTMIKIISSRNLLRESAISAIKCSFAALLVTGMLVFGEINCHAACSLESISLDHQNGNSILVKIQTQGDSEITTEKHPDKLVLYLGECSAPPGSHSIPGDGAIVKQVRWNYKATHPTRSGW